MKQIGSRLLLCICSPCSAVGHGAGPGGGYGGGLAGGGGGVAGGVSAGRGCARGRGRGDVRRGAGSPRPHLARAVHPVQVAQHRLLLHTLDILDAVTC